MTIAALMLAAAMLLAGSDARPRGRPRPARLADASARVRDGLRRRATRRPDPMTPVNVAHLTAVGLAAGLTLGRTLEFCASRGPEPARAELVAILRRAAQLGLAAAVLDHEGALGPFLTVLAGAIRAGAPQEPLIRAYAREARAAIVTDRITRARKLPAQLAIPLALLLLPGFVLMVMGPTVLAIAERMLLPLGAG